MKIELKKEMFDGSRRYCEIARMCGCSWQQVQGFARKYGLTYAHFKNGVLIDVEPVYNGLRDIDIKINADSRFFSNPFNI